MRDAHLIYSNAQAITTSAPSTVAIEQPARTPGRFVGTDLWVNVAVAAPFLNCTSLQVILQHADAAGGTWEDVVLSPVITRAGGGLAAGRTLLSVKVAQPLRKFRRISYVVAGTAEAANTARVHAWESVQPLIAPA